MSNLITINEFNSYAPEVDTSRYTDTTVSGFLSMATNLVTDYLGYNPQQTRQVNEKVLGYVSTEGDLVFAPKKIPLVSIENLSIVKGSTEIAITLTSGDSNYYDITPSGRQLRVPAGEIAIVGYPLFSNFYSLKGTTFYLKATYTAGYLDSDMPSSIKYACSLYARDILARSQNTAGAKKISQGGISIEYAQRDGKSDFVKDAETILNAYIL